MRPQITSICDIALGKFSVFPFFFFFFNPYLCWEQEAIEPKLKNLESPTQCLSLTLVLFTRFCVLLLPPSLPFWKVELKEGTGYVRSPKANGSPERPRAKQPLQVSSSAWEPLLLSFVQTQRPGTPAASQGQRPARLARSRMWLLHQLATSPY